MAFYSLHNHDYSSNIRFLDSINRPNEMIDKALRLGFGGIAFTNHESLSSAVAVLKERDRIKKDHPDFKIIFGNEIYLIDASEIKNTLNYYHFILLAKDAEGWEQLKRLSSRAWDRGYTERGIMRVPTTYQDVEEIVGKNPGHLVAQTACIGGRLAKNILDHDVQKANQFVKWCISVFGRGNFFLEMQPSDSEEQIIVNKTLLKFSVHYNIPYVVTTDSHYLDKEDLKIQSAFLNSKQSGDRETEKFYKYTYMMEEQEMIDLLKLSISEEEAKQAIKNTEIVGNMISEFDFRHTTIVPTIKIPAFRLGFDLYRRGYPAIDKFYESKSEQDKYLIYQIEQGVKEKSITLDETKLGRINTELDVIDYLGEKLGQPLSAYLNLTKNIEDIAWKVSLCAPGRGSSTGFYINYLIGITQLDTLKYNLNWWRFLNKERVELPDVDSDFQPEKKEEIIKLLRQEYGEDNVLNCATFKTESLKSAILTSGRGLGFNNDDMQALAALVPQHRGMTYTLKECLEGDEEKGYEPVPGFADKLNVYPGLLDAVKKIEGLQTNASIHASALYVFNDGYVAHNSLMRAPNGTKITAFNMHDSDDCGALKMDTLVTDAMSKIAKCLDLLLKDGKIKWQGSLRATYNKYIHPDVLDYDSPDMWKKAAEGKITNLFQFETPVGGTCIKKARPENVMQLAEINSIMRLQSDSGEQPIDRYVRFRNDINEWYEEMDNLGLTKEEQEVLKKYLVQSNGVSGSQETLMLLVMDPQIAHFTLGEANGFRKAIAKKKPKDIQANKEKFFNYGKELGVREVFSHYVWDKMVEPQVGYAFSINHTLPYSVVAVQEMNLASRWSPLYWQCACLCVNTGNYVGEIGEDAEEEEAEEKDENENADKKAKRVAPNYGKIAKAISGAQLSGVNIALPDINSSQADFVPDVENNAILYSLQAVNVVSDDLLDRIIANRPYTGPGDFYRKVEPTQAQMIGLIKAGCFDSLCNKPREVIMNGFLQYLASQEITTKDKLTIVQLRKAIELKMPALISEYQDAIRVYKFKQYIDANQADKANKRYVFTDDSVIAFFNKFIKSQLNMMKDEYTFLPGDKIAVKMSALKKITDKLLNEVMDFLNSEKGKKEYLELVQGEFIKSLREKYCSGSISKWEMDTMCFYHNGHELANMNNMMYNVKDFNSLPENPEENNEICAIAGTVTNADNAKHIVSVLTNYGVVDVKFFSGSYAMYNQKISVVDEKTKKKTVLDDTWFKRGNKIIVYGQRRENMFVARNYREGGYNRMVGLIENISLDGTLSVRYSRCKKKIAE